MLPTLCGAHLAHAFPLLPALVLLLAFLGFKSWRRGNRGGDAQTFAIDNASEGGAVRPSAPWSRGRGFAGAPTGNVAFDEWRAGELARLEAERRKLEDAQREFAEFVESVRKAKDREEFERFMNARHPPQSGAPDRQGPAA